LKKFFESFSYSGSILLYMVLAPILLFLRTLRCLRHLDKVVYCLPDILCFDEHWTKLFLYPFILILVINILKDDFRAGVVLRYGKAEKLMLHLLAKLATFSFLVSVYQTLITIALGLHYAQYQCNWDSSDGLPFFLVGAIVKDKPSTVTIILAYFFSVFITTMVIGMMVTALWWLTETPITGFVCMVALLSVETGVNIYIHVLFSVVDLQPENVYMWGISPWNIVFYPVILLLIFFVAGILIIKKRDFMRIN